ncbi:prepilin-type N-terminal cleavage/methylation domain-containing protein [Candidatus Parcubacteria bacterium]|nr:prepilin-type N-terminal cleavage/methylation domain-containing protein [Candidatus Parcubacteria bacterium]
MSLIKKFKKQAGFTLMELLASMFIVVLLTGIFLTNYHGANERNKLIMATQKLASDIRMAQNYALGAKEFEGDIPVEGWGVRLEEGNGFYKIFADNDDNGFYDYDLGEEYKIINLPDGIIVKSIDIGNLVDIVFLPPNPITYINDVSDTSVKIELTDGKTDKTIKVNFLGLIDVID